jgi:hypothetical protein
LRAFLDFEASSLGRHGFPIEVAWVFENGVEEIDERWLAVSKLTHACRLEAEF